MFLVIRRDFNKREGGAGRRVGVPAAPAADIQHRRRRRFRTSVARQRHRHRRYVYASTDSLLLLR